MRSEEIQKEVEKIIDLVSQDSSVKSVFLFGSSAHPHELHEDSDLDLCIVQETNLRFYDRLAEWIDRIEPEVGLDIIVYTPEEFEKLSRENQFVSEQIENKGQRIYAA
ncbi:MAG: nucleotidyltransferase domain-containing protein [Opitutales bacterium]|nr:nucleotidyltransferase domain-containing protein [Opitutales bacterium]